jgi:lipopolysaccharide export system protein LptA
MRISTAALLLACFLPLTPARAEQLSDPLPDLTIGVAPFQQGNPAGGEAPDVGAPLAAAIAALGVARIVGPEQLKALDVEEPDADLVREIAMQVGIDAVVLGRTTRLGNRVSLDVRLRSGRSGAIADTFVAEVASSEPLEPVLVRLAEQVLSGARAVRAGQPQAPRVSNPPPAAAAPAPVRAAEEPEKAHTSFGLEALEGGPPLTIRSDELEATEQEGARTLTFRSNVEVRRGDLTLRADQLQAFYPPGAKQPRELAARGGVTVVQGARLAHCDRAVYEHTAARIVCRGNAGLRDGEDRIRGERIIFDLAERRVSVEGDVRLSLQPRAESPRAEADAPREAPELMGEDLAVLASDAPLAIRADRLEAFEHDGRRQIRFEGQVEVVRSDVVLRSQRLEALYPDGARQPDRLVATGEVALTQGEREARCNRAVYHRGTRRVECSGQAELKDGDDHVRGEMIAFDLDAETVVVTGGTRLFFRPDGETQETALP